MSTEYKNAWILNMFLYENVVLKIFFLSFIVFLKKKIYMKISPVLKAGSSGSIRAVFEKNDPEINNPESFNH